MNELMKLIREYNMGAKKMLKWFNDHMDDPLFETEDGQRLLMHSTEIAGASAMLNLVAVKMSLEDVLLDIKLQEND